MRLLISEDQQTLREILKKRLKEDGFSVDDAPDGQEAMSLLEHTVYDVVILDIMMPYYSGLEVLTWMREQKIQTPVIMLTAKDKVSDRVKGLNAGADDYLIKPFAYDELKARIQSLLRRQDKTIENVLSLGELTMNRTTKEVIRANQSIHLSKKEFNILEYMMLHEGEVLSRERLEEASTDFDYEGYSNVIDVYIKLLRKKIDKPFDQPLIHTVRGFGYVLKVDA
jgi:DNA-binding response OmpR family regulator